MHGEERAVRQLVIRFLPELRLSAARLLPICRATRTRTFDLVITDPPFGDNIFYSDLANFFYAWLRLPLRKEYPELFDAVKTPNAQEALAPRLLPEEEANEYYRVRLTACWAEAYRVLKDGGLLAFTFHHSEDSQWAVVLQASSSRDSFWSRRTPSPATR